MAYTIEKPTVVENTSPMGGDTYKHPAYGLVTLSQVSGQTTLFGSDLGHHAAMRITVQRAKLDRSLGRDWIHGDEMLVEFELSHAQYAQFITSQGNGSGTPVTLISAPEAGAKLVQLPGIENIQSKADLHREEIRRSSVEQIATIREELDKINTLVESGTIPKKELKARLFSLNAHVGNLPGNMEYTVKSAEKALETATEHAKIEVESYIGMTVNRLGLESLSQLAQLAQLENKEKVIG